MENLVAKIKAELNVFVENADAQVERVIRPPAHAPARPLSNS